LHHQLSKDIVITWPSTRALYKHQLILVRGIGAIVY